MNPANVAILAFAAFAIGFPIWAMQNNDFDGRDNHGCSGACYEKWKEETGGVVVMAQAQAAAKAAASPVELGKMAYTGCIACHGAGGEGGVGPQLSGQSADMIAGKLLQYKAGETIGNQSALMWSQAAQLSDADIDNLAAFVDSL